MKNIKEDSEGFTSHRIVSTEKLMNTHSRAIKELLQQISNSYNISVGDAAVAVSNVMNRLGEIK